jgi:AcrR family transcriptional regulator
MVTTLTRMTSPANRVRMTPDDRREQLLALGVRLLSTRSLDELSIETLAEEAGISRGLLYHYFGNKQDFHRAVVRKAADDLIAVTAPAAGGDPVERLAASLDRYVAYVEANYAGYTSLVRGAAGGNEELRQIYEEARSALTDRIFGGSGGGGGGGALDAFAVADTQEARLMVRGWSALAEEVVLSWVRDPGGVRRSDLLRMLTAALPGTLSGTTTTG